MTPEKWEKVGEIFNSALEKDAAELDDYLAAACDGDSALRDEVESLLAAGQDAGKFISEPVAGNFVADFADHISALAPGNLIGHYRIEEAIGSGGMGEVYLATDTRLGRKVALKTLPPSYSSDPSFLKRFRNEAQAAANINHPNVATVYSVEECDGIQFLTMEYIEGKTLDRLTTEGGLEIKTFVEWLEPIAHALHAAHKRGIIHRDIKPGNIMISNDGTPKILDFGLAQLERSLAGNVSIANDITAPGQIIGTPSYMSPEQANGAAVDIRSDIFSFGTVMYEALTGKRPFRGPSQGLIVKAVIHSEPEPITKYRSDSPQALTKMVERCLQKSPESRFQSMRDVRSILKEARAASDAGVSMDSFARRFYHEAKSSSKLWLAPAALIVVALAVFAWWYFPTTQSRFPIRFENMGMRRFSDADNVGYAQISPDGRSVAFATAEDDGTRSLWIRRIDDRNPLLLVPPQRLQYYWGGLAISNDGGQVFYLTAGRTANFGTLFRISSLGGPPRKVVDSVNDIGGISPDDQSILLVRYGDQARIIAVNTTDGGNERLILEAPAGEGRRMNFRDPHFSRDGKSVFFIRTQNHQGIETWSIESIDLESKKVTSFISQPARISELAVLPDSSGVVFTAVDSVSNLQQVFHLNFGDGSKTRLTNDLHFYFGVNIDAQGKTILVSQRSDEQQLWIGDTRNLSKLEPTIKEPLPYRNVEWTPDGRVVYDAYDNNVAQIWIANADGSNRQKLTSSGRNFEPKVSPDGQFIVFTSRRGGHNQVYLMNIDGGLQTLLADVPGVTQAPRFSADGQTVVFDWFSDSDRWVARVARAGGTVEKLLSPDESVPSFNTYYWAMSPDGKFIAHSIWVPEEDRMKIAVRSVDNPEPTAILDIWPSIIFKWSPDGKSIVYRERQAGYQPENTILQVDVATGRTQSLLMAGRDQVVDFSYSRDQKKVAVVRGRNSSNAVILTAVPKDQ